MLSDYKFARSAVLNILQSTSKKNYEYEEILETIDHVFKIQPKWMETVNRELLVKDIKEHLTIFIPDKIAIFSDETSGRHIDWLENKIKSKDLKWDFWSRYEEYLSTQSKMAPMTIQGINDQTQKILSQIEDPDREGPWSTKGVVVGSVQSGKTANYSGLIAKAIDAGYKRIIVLCGLNNDLRSQTQERLEESVIGEIISNISTNRKIGVGSLGYDIPALNTATSRDEKGDFSKPIASRFRADKERATLLMIKKNVSILENLLYWIHLRDCGGNYDDNVTWKWRPQMETLLGGTLETQRPYVKDTPLLIIDDECDNASVDTGNQAINDNVVDEDYDPKKTNQLIRRILFSYEKSAYIGYTATPYSNIFIDRRQETSREGEDLWPRDFIINLPTPSNYIGPQQIFYDLDDEEDLERGVSSTYIKNISDHAKWTNIDGEWKIHKREIKGWMPPKHDITHEPRYKDHDVIPPSLRDAVNSFLISCAIRKLRGYDEGNTMLIHVSRFVDVSKRVGDQVQKHLTDLKKVVLGDKEAFKFVKKTWDEDYSKNLNANNNIPNTTILYQDIENIIIEQLELNKYKIALMNGKAEDKKNCDLIMQAQGNAIAIGGQRLSRGLTLKSLIVSYFLRHAQTTLTDTMTQMGRWFGYRVGYDDLCRLFIPQSTEKQFRDFALTEADLRKRIQDMSELGRTPNEYALMLQSHPGILVTSRQKLRRTRKIKIDYNNYHGQSVVLYKNEENDKNIVSVEHLLNSLGNHTKPSKRGLHYLWTGVDSSKIRQFLKSYITHPSNQTFKSDIMSTYIENMNKDFNELSKWSVGLHSGDANDGFIGSLKHLPVKFSLRTSNQKPENIDEKKHQFQGLTAADHEAFDLIDLEKDKALQRYQSLRLSPEESLRKYYRWVRGLAYDKIEGDKDLLKTNGFARGLLLIYPVVAYKNDKKPLIGLGLSFPQTKSIMHSEYLMSEVDFENLQKKNDEDQEDDEY